MRAFVRELAEELGFCHEKVNSMEVAVDEVFTNAIEHGSASVDSPVVVQCLSTDEMMEIVVSDTGGGEDRDTSWVSDWTHVVDDEIESWTERGHGLLLAYRLVDEMSMEPNEIGGIEVHLGMYKKGKQIGQE
jgi:anti-sigma regulatory factor (Ser/Thr protein kinase)